MCFSATASFIAGAGLGALGVTSLKRAKTKQQLPLASIPVIFAVQQIAEGVVWLSLTRDGWEGLQYPASYLFLTIAQIIWAVLFPVAFFKFETDPLRKKWLRLFVLPGIVVSIYFMYCLVFRDMVVSAEGHHVSYNIDFPKPLIPFAAGLYLVATVIPPLLSRDLRIKGMGVILLGSYLLARLFFQPSLISIWCFFAMAVSILIFFVLLDRNKDGAMV